MLSKDERDRIPSCHLCPSEALVTLLKRCPDDSSIDLCLLHAEEMIVWIKARLDHDSRMETEAGAALARRRSGSSVSDLQCRAGQAVRTGRKRLS